MLEAVRNAFRLPDLRKKLMVTIRIWCSAVLQRIFRCPVWITWRCNHCLAAQKACC